MRRFFGAENILCVYLYVSWKNGVILVILVAVALKLKLHLFQFVVDLLYDKFTTNQNRWTLSLSDRLSQFNVCGE